MLCMSWGWLKGEGREGRRRGSVETLLATLNCFSSRCSRSVVYKIEISNSLLPSLSGRLKYIHRSSLSWELLVAFYPTPFLHCWPVRPDADLASKLAVQGGARGGLIAGGMACGVLSALHFFSENKHQLRLGLLPRGTPWHVFLSSEIARSFKMGLFAGVVIASVYL